MRLGAPLALCLLAGCAQNDAPPVATCPRLPTRAPPVTAIPPKPTAPGRLVLMPGHWEWMDGNYNWSPPTWVPPPHPHAPSSGKLWQDGRWTPNGIVCVWEAGRFLF